LTEKVVQNLKYNELMLILLLHFKCTVPW